jgi:hypothetical protein
MNFENHTHYPAGWTLGFEPDGRELLIIVVKATFTIPDNGEMPQLAEEQVPLVEADQFTGEPGYSATLCETDYAHRKTFCDVLLNGSAYAPGGRPSKQVTVSMQVGSMKKVLNVIGHRKWDRILMQDTPSLPLPFVKKAISYDCAFGGVDIDQNDESRAKTYLLNPVGVGFYPISSGKELEGKPLPNTEEVGRPVLSAKTGSFQPMAFGPVGRNFVSRSKYAGTYDQNWLDNHAPFWPDDFDYRYFQAAPQEQQISYPKGGEPVLLKNLTPLGTCRFRLPKLEIPVFVNPYRDNAKQLAPVIDTVFFEPDHGRFTMTWRVALPLKRNCFELKDVIIGKSMEALSIAAQTGGKHYH